MDRIKSLSLKVLETHKPKFGRDFADNKKALNQIAIVRSKGLKNEIAGYITNYIKREQMEEEAKLARIRAAQAEEAEQRAREEAEKIQAEAGDEPADAAIPEAGSDESPDAAPEAAPDAASTEADPGTVDHDAPASPSAQNKDPAS